MVRCQSGRLFEDFHSKSLVAVGWSKLGAVSPKDSPEDLLKRAKAAGYNPKGADSGGWQVWRFANRIEPGDRIVTYDPSRRVYAVGEAVQKYAFDPTALSADYPHVRHVKWLGDVPRDALSPASKNSLGSGLTLFEVPAAAAAEIVSALKGQSNTGEVTASIEKEISQFADVFKDIENRSFEFIKDRVDALDWDEMQELIAGILRALGYKTRVAKPGPDRGADIVASPDGLGFENPRILVEVKHRIGPMSAKDVRSFLGGRHKDDRGLYVSTGGFTKDARYEADRGTIPLTMWELDDVVENLTRYYDQLDSETRQLVPLKRLYWPT